MSNYNNNKMLYRTLSFLLLSNAVLVTVSASAIENESRSLQAGSYGGGGSSSSGSGAGSAAAVGLIAGLAAKSGFFSTILGKIVLGIIILIVIIIVVVRCIKKNQGNAPSETKFFEGNDQQDTPDNDNIDKFQHPFYSGLYTGIYDQKGTRMPVQPFEIYFQEQFIEADDEDEYVGTIFHTITGKGADMVGPYTLSGKSVGNKISLTKKYYGAGNHVTDVGHEVTLRLDKLGDSHIFEGKFFVSTNEVHEQGLYQMWPVGYNNNANNNTALSTPPSAAAVAVAEIDEENQIPVATATAMVGENEENFQTISLDDERRQKY
jgi:hypothetical protein